MFPRHCIAGDHEPHPQLTLCFVNRTCQALNEETERASLLSKACIAQPISGLINDAAFLVRCGLKDARTGSPRTFDCVSAMRNLRYAVLTLHVRISQVVRRRCPLRGPSPNQRRCKQGCPQIERSIRKCGLPRRCTITQPSNPLVLLTEHDDTFHRFVRDEGASWRKAFAARSVP